MCPLAQVPEQAGNNELLILIKNVHLHMGLDACCTHTCPNTYNLSLSLSLSLYLSVSLFLPFPTVAIVMWHLRKDNLKKL